LVCVAAARAPCICVHACHAAEVLCIVSTCWPTWPGGRPTAKSCMDLRERCFVSNIRRTQPSCHCASQPACTHFCHLHHHTTGSCLCHPSVRASPTQKHADATSAEKTCTSPLLPSTGSSCKLPPPPFGSMHQLLPAVRMHSSSTFNTYVAGDHQSPPCYVPDAPCMHVVAPPWQRPDLIAYKPASFT
jgi:hypothetical protein